MEYLVKAPKYFIDICIDQANKENDKNVKDIKKQKAQEVINKMRGK